MSEDASKHKNHRCPFCTKRFDRLGRRGLASRCRACGARRLFDVESSCCAGAAVWVKATIRLCADCTSTIIRSRAPE